VAGGGDAGGNRDVRADQVGADELRLGMGSDAKDTTLGLATVATVVGARAILMRHGYARSVSRR
jgi:hypothetical protein